MTSNDSKLIKKDYLKKINLINKYNEAYYKNSKPIIADFEYDNLKIEILDLEKKYNFLKSDKSPSLTVGFKPSKIFKKVQHKIPMLSLSNAFDKEVSEYELWKKVLEVNLNGTYLVSREVVKVMIKQNQGSIVNLSSIMGQVVYPEYLNSLTSPYPVSKGGIVQYTKNLASFVGDKNIRVNCVSPAFIYTELTKNILDDELIGTKLKNQHPMKRFGTPEEVAETICFLASDKASFITGVDLPCDGGYLIL